MKIVSDVLGRELTLQVSTSALRTFDKHGGMDRYLLRSRIDKLDQGLSRELRTACELSILNCQQKGRHIWSVRIVEQHVEHVIVVSRDRIRR